ncbi:MAG: malate dehydrogenase [Candidatus Bostrichicola ureolyticus]|nr:MAG: malate dehydrogenase [Candidatus Bostrichicola ureolyticus]
MKITIIGAGNVGATSAEILFKKNVVKEIILLDVKKNLAEGKAIDISQTAPINGSYSKIIGVTNDYSKTENSKVIVITSGITRKYNMSRDDLININANIVKSVIKKSIEYSPDTIFIVVSNPLDVMTYVAFISSKINASRVFGMAGILDKARYCTFLATELNCYPQDIQTLLLGSHGDTMVPLPRYTTVSGIPIIELIDKSKIDSIIERTKKGGLEIVNMLGTSAWYAPGAAVAQMVESIIKDSKRIFPCSAWLQGEYGLKNIYLGVPVILGKNGIEKILELKLNNEEMNFLKKSAEHITNMIKVIDKSE